jgi:hypothetical protein
MRPLGSGHAVSKRLTVDFSLMPPHTHPVNFRNRQMNRRYGEPSEESQDQWELDDWGMSIWDWGDR